MTRNEIVILALEKFIDQTTELMVEHKTDRTLKQGLKMNHDDAKEALKFYKTHETGRLKVHEALNYSIKWIENL